MKRIVLAALACALAATSASMAFAQPDRGHGQQQSQQQGRWRRHDEWRKGARIQKEDWSRGQRAD
jgi:Ni/Co efflux regulator RcnB